jgi:hypothetical protein
MKDIGDIGTGIGTTLAETSREMAAKHAIQTFNAAVKERETTTTSAECMITVTFTAGPITIQIDEVPVQERF